MAKGSFVLYYDIRGPLSLLSDEDRGRLIMGILDYAELGIEPKFEGALQMAFAFIRNSLDRDAKAWERKSERRAEAGRKGGKQTQANQAIASFAKQNKQSQANQAVPVPVPVPVKDEKGTQPVPAAVPAEPFPYEEYRQVWIEECGSLPKPATAKTWNQSRRKALRSKSVSLEEWRGICKKIEQSDFLTGRSGRWAGCGFDWVLKPGNWQKILEGNYDNPRGKMALERTYDPEELEEMASFDVMEGDT